MLKRRDELRVLLNSAESVRLKRIKPSEPVELERFEPTGKLSDEESAEVAKINVFLGTVHADRISQLGRRVLVAFKWGEGLISYRFAPLEVDTALLVIKYDTDLGKTTTHSLSELSVKFEKCRDRQGVLSAIKQAVCQQMEHNGTLVAQIAEIDQIMDDLIGPDTLAGQRYTNQASSISVSDYAMHAGEPLDKLVLNGSSMSRSHGRFAKRFLQQVPPLLDDMRAAVREMEEKLKQIEEEEEAQSAKRFKLANL